ncbi:hypothetical protein D3C77_456100 [compost metagenome]
MTFGGEVYDPARTFQLVDCSYVNFACFHFASLAGSRVQAIIFRETLLEHQRDAFTHYANGIHRVDEGFGLGFQKVALGKSDHWKYHPGRA